MVVYYFLGICYMVDNFKFEKVVGGYDSLKYKD